MAVLAELRAVGVAHADGVYKLIFFMCHGRETLLGEVVPTLLHCRGRRLGGTEGGDANISY